MKIGIDVMGGDYAPKATIAGSVLALSEISKNDTIVLIGDEKIIADELKNNNVSKDNFEIIHAPDVIEMGEAPTRAFSSKPNSSISIGFKLLKDKKIDAIAGAGNSGAMLVGAMYTVKAVPGVLRPCITSVLPKENGGVGLILDVGINSDCKPDVLYQFGILGTLFLKHVYNVANPKVGLLNIGEEPEKGNLVTQAAYNLMKDTKEFSFFGNVEGRDLFNDKADVIVCEGFTGNVVLKTAEAFFTMMYKRRLLDDYFKRFNYENYGGTPILGINGTVIIGHGISSDKAIKNMLLLAAETVKANLPEKIKEAFQ